MKNLQSTFEANAHTRPVYKERLTKVIDSFLHATDHHTKANFCGYLNVNGINPVFRENRDGRDYGITFIDNRKGAVINGGDLGKHYSGQVLVKRFNQMAAGERKRQDQVDEKLEWSHLERFDHSQPNRMRDLSMKLLDLMMKPEKSFSEPINPNLKRRRKRRRGLSR